MSILKQLQDNHSKPGTWVHPGVDLGLVVSCDCKAECHLVAWGKIRAVGPPVNGVAKRLFQDDKGGYRYTTVPNKQVFPLAILGKFKFVEPCASVRVPPLDKKSALKVAQELALFHTATVLEQSAGQYYRVAPCSHCGKLMEEVLRGRPTDKAYYLYLNEAVPVMSLLRLANEACVCPKE